MSDDNNCSMGNLAYRDRGRNLILSHLDGLSGVSYRYKV